MLAEKLTTPINEKIYVRGPSVFLNQKIRAKNVVGRVVPHASKTEPLKSLRGFFEETFQKFFSSWSHFLVKPSEVSFFNSSGKADNLVLSSGDLIVVHRFKAMKRVK